ncbi:MAG: hypothetical protein FJW31_13265 [Acidobacteria bacterium]|nr:hypothetical protein [Acidobacteriota bacterium]
MTLRPMLFALGAAAAAFCAAEPLSVRQVILEPGAQPVIQVRFSHPLERGAAANLDPANVTMAPGTVRVQRITHSPGRTNELQLYFTGALSTQFVSVRFAQLLYRDAGAMHTAEGVDGLSTESAADELERLRARVQQIPKSSQQRHLSASGFVTAARGSSQGGAELSLNPALSTPGMTTFLQFNKSTQPGADAKHFETGFRFRQALPWNRALLNSLAQARSPQEINRAVEAVQSRLMAGAVVDAAAKIEVAAASLAVSKFVGDVGVQLVTRTQRHWRCYAVPFAIEVGRSLHADSAVDWIARYKAGLGATLFVEDGSARYPVRRAEVDFQGVARHLIFNETMFGGSTAHGLRGYGWLDVRLYVGITPAGRYGFRFSLQQGSLPPVYAPVRSSQFGILFGSADDQE